MDRGEPLRVRREQPRRSDQPVPGAAGRLSGNRHGDTANLSPRGQSRAPEGNPAVWRPPRRRVWMQAGAATNRVSAPGPEGPFQRPSSSWSSSCWPGIRFWGRGGVASRLLDSQPCRRPPGAACRWRQPHLRASCPLFQGETSPLPLRPSRSRIRPEHLVGSSCAQRPPRALVASR